MSAPAMPDQVETAACIGSVLSAVRAGNLPHAYDLATAAVARGVRDRILYRLIVEVAIGRNEEREALAALEALHALGLNDPEFVLWIGIHFLRLRRPEQALACFNQAIDLLPNFARAHYERGVALGILGDTEEMRIAHERVLALDPRNPDALASLALIAARSGDPAVARNYASRSLEYKPDCAAARAALMVAEVVEGRFGEAQHGIKHLLEERRWANDTWIDIALSDAADTFERHERYAEAFETFLSVGERHRARQLHAVESRRAIDAVMRRADYFRRTLPWPPSTPGPEAAPVQGHAFLLGFMRSGTTLLQTILASSVSVCAMDERELLAAPAGRFLFSNEGLDQLRTLDQADLASWRASYWNAVREIDSGVDGRMFLNKMPFNSLRLPLIARFFPDARIILALRDPRDVVLSCLRHRFEPSHLTFEFLRLEDCARFYAATMELVELCRQKLPVHVYEHRYEDMIADFEGAVRAVCTFVGIEWSNAMHNFVAASGVIARRSQSAAQVRRGLYTSGVGQWRRCREQMAPALPILEPWIKRFGYHPD
jgi:Flp pilus assembly protein TadD